MPSGLSLCPDLLFGRQGRICFFTNRFPRAKTIGEKTQETSSVQSEELLLRFIHHVANSFSNFLNGVESRMEEKKQKLTACVVCCWSWQSIGGVKTARVVSCAGDASIDPFSDNGLGFTFV